MTAEGRAREIVGAVRENRPFDTIYLVALGHIRETERAAAARARREALEQIDAPALAGRIADALGLGGGTVIIASAGHGAIINAIRALALASDEVGEGELGGG